VETVTEQNLVVNGKNERQSVRQTFYLRWTPKGAENGNFTIVQRILAATLEANGPFMARQPASSLGEFHKQLAGSEFTLTIGQKDGKYRVKKVQGVSALVDKLNMLNPALGPFFRKVLTGDTFKQMAEPMLGVIPPNETIPRDKSWKNVTTLDLGPLGSYATMNRYTVEGREKDKRLLRIKVETDMSYTKPKGPQPRVAGFVVVDGKLKSAKGSGGTILFNVDKGRLESAEIRVNLEGTMKIDIANTVTAVKVAQTQVTRIRTSDRRPDY
jgi:hypothetical protein